MALTSTVCPLCKERPRSGPGRKCKPCAAEAIRQYRREHPERQRVQDLNRRGRSITVAEYDEMFERQEGLCAICRQPENVTRKGITRRLCVDHCHSTGRIRGLLCTKCNQAIGLLGDDAERMVAAAKYVST